MSFAIGVILFLVLLFLFFVVLIIIGLTTDKEKSETRKPSVFSSLTSKLPKVSMNVRTIISVILVVATIIIVIITAIEVVSFLVALMPENFSDDTTSQDYWYDGNFLIVNESLKINGKAVFSNSETSNDFFRPVFGPVYCENPDFDIFGEGKGTIKIVMDNGNKTQIYEKEIPIDGPFRIEFGTCSSWERIEDAVYFELNDESLTIDEDPVFFYTDQEFSIIGYFNGSIVVYKIGAGA